MTTWTDTTLWKVIDDRPSPATVLLSQIMPQIESILRSGGTASLEFTLHDDEHSFRVAQRMATLVEPNRLLQLSVPELSLLLLSAYLHDIGMTPALRVSRRYFDYLVTGKTSTLLADEIDSLQRWLDKYYDGITSPIPLTAITSSDIRKIEEIYAYFTRHMHNEWSDLWIRSEISTASPALYPNWIEDLIALCRSHHDGLNALRNPRFDAKIVGQPASAINLRYLAAILRLADVLEFDPERTPSVILSHRSIPPKNRIYWHKDHSISFHVEEETHRLLYSARTPSAAIHRAVLQTAEAVNDELVLCSTLQDEGGFVRGNIPEEKRIQYLWPWPPRLSMDIKEQHSSFIYIDGAFRPSTERILSLLSGTALYGDPLAAVRELVQNAIDAVREQIAHERLAKDHPDDPSLETLLARLHKVRLTFEKRDGTFWLLCSDDGAGMTKEIIEQHFLVGGAPIRSDLRALERNASAANFTFGRTGQFGIGVLSYFMISDKIDVVTRRSQEGLDRDNCGWHFSSEGLGAFGELRKAARTNKGTDIALRLRGDFLGDNPQKWFFDLVKYIKDTLRWSPCQIDIVDLVGSGGNVVLNPGWTATTADFTETALSAFKHTDRDELQTAAERELNLHYQQKRRLLCHKAESVLSWFGPREAILPMGQGIIRVWIPYFNFDNHAAMGFPSCEMDDDTGILDGDLVNIWSTLIYSWKGMRVQGIEELARGKSVAGGQLYIRSRAFVEVDLWSGFEISVDRHHLLGTALEDLREAIKLATQGAYASFFEWTRNSRYLSLNRAIYTEYHDDPGTKGRIAGAFWLDGRTNFPAWSNIGLPAVDMAMLPEHMNNREYTYMNRRVFSIGILECEFSSSDYKISDSVSGGRLVFPRQGGRFLPWATSIWTPEDEHVEKEDRFAIDAGLFPDGWEKLALVEFGGVDVFNWGNVLIRAAGLSRYSWFRSHSYDNSEAGIRRLMSSGLAGREAAAGFILGALRFGSRVWDLYREIGEAELLSILRLARMEDVLPIYWWDVGNNSSYSLSLQGISARQRAFLDGKLTLPGGKKLLVPDDEAWWLTVESGGPPARGRHAI